jgi:hypothetical protein
MSKERSKAELAKAIYPPKFRSSLEIHQEYVNVCATIGDAHFGMEINRAKMQQSTMQAGKLKDEYNEALAREKKQEERKNKRMQEAEAQAPEPIESSSEDETIKEEQLSVIP